MKVLVTGASGQLGQDVVDLFRVEHEVLACGHNEMDVTDEERVMFTVQGFAPDVIIHTAAYTAVDLAEQEPEIAYNVNAIGCFNIASAAKSVGAKLCAISTDYVFDGQATSPYLEDAQTNPKSVYGKTKLQGEKLIQQVTSNFFIVRTSWVFGLRGNNFVRTMLRMAEKGMALRVVDDQVGCPTYTRDLAMFILKLVTTEDYGVYHVSNSGACSWYEFACAIFKESGLKVQVSPCTTEEYLRPAPRPAYSVMESKSIMNGKFQALRSWREALRSFLSEYQPETTRMGD